MIFRPSIHTVFYYLFQYKCAGDSIQHSFATAAEKLHLHGRYWSKVRALVQSSQAEGSAVELIKTSSGSGAVPIKKGNVKDMQDMAYLLYI